MSLASNLERLCLSLQPSRRQLIILEVLLRLRPDISIVVIEPGLFGAGEEAGVDKLAAVRHHSDVLEPEVRN